MLINGITVVGVVSVVGVVDRLMYTEKITLRIADWHIAALVPGGALKRTQRDERSNVDPHAV